MFEWFDRVGYDVDIAALQRDFLEVRWHSFADWAREFDWRVLEQTFFPAGVTDRRNPGGSGSQCQFLELRRVTSPLPRDFEARVIGPVQARAQGSFKIADVVCAVRLRPVRHLRRLHEISRPDLRRR